MTSAAPSSLAVGDRPAEAAKEEPIEFVPISNSVHVYRPEKGAKKGNNKSTSSNIPSVLKPINVREAPRAVVIMGWMDAPLRIVSKYAAPYAKLFPDATIIVELSTGKSFMASSEARKGQMGKVIKILEEVQSSNEARNQLHEQVAELEKSSKQAGLRLDVDSQNKYSEQAEEEPESGKGNVKSIDGSIMIHSFSDGGARNTSLLLELLAQGKAPPVSAMIFDCSPGRATPSSGAFAFTVPLAKRPILRAFARGIIYFGFTVLYMVRRVLRRQTWSQIMRTKLNSSDLWSRKKTLKTTKQNDAVFPPRMYLYSKADKLIDWKAVEDHAREAAKIQGLDAPLQVEKLSSSKSDHQNGKVVAVRRWENANHCDLGRADFDGYWTAIRSFLQAVL